MPEMFFSEKRAEIFSFISKEIGRKRNTGIRRT